MAFALIVFGATAQIASAATSGQTIFECTTAATNKTFSDAHCDTPSGTLAYGHVPLVQGEKTPIKGSNAKTTANTGGAVEAIGMIHNFHGINLVTFQCRNVETIGEMKAMNLKEGEVHEGSGKGALGFNDGAGEPECRTNQVGCKVKVSEMSGEAVTVESVGGASMGLEFKPLAGAAKFGTAKWEGTCGLAAFPAFPIAGSAVATAHGAANGAGATAVFGADNSLTIGASVLEFTATLTFEQANTQKALVLTTNPFLNDA